MEITLRPITLEDATEEYLSWVKSPYLRTQEFNTILDLRRYIKKQLNADCLFWAIELDKKHIGNVKIDLNGTSGNIGILISPKHRGKGYGRIAIRQACDKALDMGLKRILANVDLNNEPSLKAFTKAGFKQYGVALEVKC